jgi:hemerythrin-like domain-containing protein
MSTPTPSGARIELPGLHSPAAGFDQPFEMLAACHERVQRSLDLLARLIDHLQRRSASHPTEPVDTDARSAAADVGRYFDLAAPQHHRDEETHVIPRLQASGEAPLRAAADQMLADHRAIEAVWARLGPLLAALRAGPQAPTPVDLPALAAAAAEFIALHAQHVPLEDRLAFPAAQAAMGADAQAAMGREMAARRRAPTPGHRAD